MNIHEYQAREIFRSHGLPVPDSVLAETAEQAREAAARFGGTVVIKAQVHAGGRGKAGGVKLASGPAEAGEAAAAILGMEIKGLVVEKVLVAPAVEIATEAYVGIVMDRASQRPVMMVSPEGGVDIEEVAATKPEAIFKEAIDPRYGLMPHEATGLAYRLFSDPALAKQAGRVLAGLWSAYEGADATLAEVNPLVSTPEGEVLAIDAKMNIDDSSLFRQPEIAAMRDEGTEDSSERRAREAGLSYIKLDGDVGCCVNGAGLAMATMDLVKYYGGSPANFLDIGGSVQPRESRRGLGDHHAGSERPLHPLQHLRRDHPLRRRGERHRGSDRSTRPGRADHDPAHGHEREGRGEDPGGGRIRGRHGHGSGRPACRRGRFLTE